jgi:hypothetical protein
MSNKKPGQISMSFTEEEWMLLATHAEIGGKRLSAYAATPENKKAATLSFSLAHRIANWVKFKTAKS